MHFACSLFMPVHIDQIAAKDAFFRMKGIGDQEALVNEEMIATDTFS